MTSTPTTAKQKSSSARFATKLLIGLLLTTFVLVCIHLLLQYLNLSVYAEKQGQIFELSNRMDLDDESSIPTWFAQAITLSIGLTAALAAYMQKNAVKWRLWAIISVFGFIFAIDEIAAMHEMALQILHLLAFKEAVPTVFDNAWVMILPIVLGVGGWLAYLMYKHFPKRTVILFVIGSCIFLIGAVGIDILASTEAKNTFFSQGILVAEEETLELIGSILVLYAVVDYLERYYKTHIRAALAQLRGK